MNRLIAKYSFNGAVTDNFGKEISGTWRAETIASSMREAIANIQFQFKKKYGLEKSLKINLHGSIEKV